MNDEDKQRLIAELEAIAASIRDPAQRGEVLEILARLHDEWPNDDELTLLFQQIDIALKNQWFRQNRNFLSVSLTY